MRSVISALTSRAVVAIAVATILVSACSKPATHGSCKLVGEYDGRAVYKEADGVVSFVANVDVNTDGALKSYHPNDPGNYDSGKLDTRLALNTVCNGLNILKADGTVLYGPGQCRNVLREYARLRPLGWRDAAGISVKWFGIAATSPRAPCIDAPSGFFVSQTARPLDGALPTCDPARWPDALLLSSIVLPYDQSVKNAGVRLGDVALVREPGGKMTGALFMDTNNKRLGEASVKVAKDLRGIAADPNGYRETLKLKLPKAEYFVFPGTAAQVGKLTNASEPQIQKAAAALAIKHGVAGRNACEG